MKKQNSKFSWGRGGAVQQGNVTVSAFYLVWKGGNARKRGQAAPAPPQLTVPLYAVTEQSFPLFSHFISQLFESHMLWPNSLCLLLFSTATHITYSILSNL